MIKFDISGIPKNSTLSSANVLVYDYCPSYSGEKQLCAYTDKWDDQTITWNNAATEGVVLSKFYTLVMYGWEKFDVKNYLLTALQNDKKWVSFYIKQVYGGYRAQFRPSEYKVDTSLRPKLEMEGNFPTHTAPAVNNSNPSKRISVVTIGNNLHIVTPYAGRQHISLVAMNGRCVEVFNGVAWANEIIVPVSAVSTGVYMLEVHGVTGHDILKVFVK